MNRPMQFRLPMGGSEGVSGGSLATIDEILEDGHGGLYTPDTIVGDPRRVTGTKRKHNSQHEVSDSHLKELQQIFEKPKVHLEKRKERLKQEENAVTNTLSNSARSVIGTGSIASSMQGPVYAGSGQTYKHTPSFSGPNLYNDYSRGVAEPQVKTNQQISPDSLNSPTCASCFKFHDTCFEGTRENKVEPQFGVKENQAHKKLSDHGLKMDIKATKSEDVRECNAKTDGGALQKDEAKFEVSNEKQCNKGDNTQDCGENKNVLKEKSDTIKDYQLHEMMCHEAIQRKLDEEYAEIQKLRGNYNSLKKLFLALAMLNIILILCVVSVMPVILVSFKMSNERGTSRSEDTDHPSAGRYSSPADKSAIKEHVFCVKCERIKESWSGMFTEDVHKGCCLEDIASLIEKVIDFQDKKNSRLESRLTKKIKYENHKQDDAILFLQKLASNSSFNGSIEEVVFGNQHEKNSRLINTLLARKRLAVHLSGKASARHHVEWKQEIPKLHPKNRRHSDHQDKRIKVENGGVYFVYVCIRFEAGFCNNKEVIGYQIMVGNGLQDSVVASVQQPCVNGTVSDTDLTLQQVVNIPLEVARTGDSMLHIKIVGNHVLISEKHHHSFGLFEI